MKYDKIAILDFGGQYAHLIADRVRRLNVYSEILDPETPVKVLKNYKGIILSGGPMSVYAEGAPRCSKKVFELGIPVLGICYGHQLMQYFLGGKVMRGETKEYGVAEVTIIRKDTLFSGIKSPTQVWMSHGDTVSMPAAGFAEAGKTTDLAYSALFNEEKKLFGVQFHPEVTHTAEGMKMLDHFLMICGAKRNWSIEKFIKEEIKAIKAKIGRKKVFLLVSGGVDSTVAFALLQKALGAKRVFGLLVDTGLMRLSEAEKVKKSLTDAGFKNLHVLDESAGFFKALKGVTDPERKRKIIGELFWKAKERAAKELHLNPKEWIVGQGTIYPDTIETGGTKHADTIKTHHNRVALMQKLIKAGRVIEPLAQLYKDEVRSLGENLGLPKALIQREPFPGPGLGVRILCADKEYAGKVSDFAALNPAISGFLREQKLLPDADVRVLPVRSVGVQGDERTYKHPAALFTASRDWNALEKASTAVTNRFPEVNRVILAVSGKSGAFRITPADVNPERVSLLQKIDNTVHHLMSAYGKDFNIWQFPVALIPAGVKSHESVVLRPIVSTEAMTARFAVMDWELIEKMAKAISGYPEISHVFYDLTHKPPGTIEWE